MHEVAVAVWWGGTTHNTRRRPLSRSQQRLKFAATTATSRPAMGRHEGGMVVLGHRNGQMQVYVGLLIPPKLR
jgi:hypothetical protein